MTTGLMPYQYVVLRCVPRPDREEFLNVGVVLFCEEAGFLGAAWHLERPRVEAFAAGLSFERLESALDGIDQICRGDAHAGFATGQRATAYGTRELVDSANSRFGLIKAPKSTVLQPGPVHGGLTADPAAELDHLLQRLVG